MQDKTRQTNILLIVGFIVIALVIGAVIYALSTKTSSDTQDSKEKQTVTKDSVSGEELTNSKNKDAETVGQNPNAPLLVGFNQLLDLGATEDDTKFVKQSITDYVLQTTSFPAKSKVSFDRKTFTQKINEDFTTDYSFSVVINDKSRYTFKVHTDSLSTITLQLLDTSGATVFSR